MPFLVCVVPVAPIRAEAAHRSEQTSQLLFGEICELLEHTKDFLRIRSVYDDYEGWCQPTQLTEIFGGELDQQIHLLAADWVNTITVNNQKMNIPFGSSLTLLQNGKGNFGKYEISYSGSIINLKESIIDETNIKTYNTPFKLQLK
jgi:hypothetical protein